MTTAKRSPAFPDVPTVAESGLQEFDYDTWYGIFAPGRTPRAVVRQINEAVGGVVRDPGLREKMLVQGVEMISSPTEVFSRLVGEDIRKLRKVVAAAGIKVD